MSRDGLEIRQPWESKPFDRVDHLSVTLIARLARSDVPPPITSVGEGAEPSDLGPGVREVATRPRRYPALPSVSRSPHHLVSGGDVDRKRDGFGGAVSVLLERH